MNSFTFTNVLILTIGVALIMSGWKKITLIDMLTKIIKGDYKFITEPAAYTGTTAPNATSPNYTPTPGGSDMAA